MIYCLFCLFYFCSARRYKTPAPITTPPFPPPITIATPCLKSTPTLRHTLQLLQHLPDSHPQGPCAARDHTLHQTPLPLSTTAILLSPTLHASQLHQSLTPPAPPDWATPSALTPSYIPPCQARRPRPQQWEERRLPRLPCWLIRALHLACSTPLHTGE